MNMQQMKIEKQKIFCILRLSLFHKNKKPIEVAISLKLNWNQVEEVYKDFWKLNNLYNLSNIYEDIKDEIPSLVEVYQILK